MINSRISLFLLGLCLLSQPVWAESVQLEAVIVAQPAIPDLPVVQQTLSREEALSIGLKNNLGLSVSAEETRYQEALLKAAKAKRLPVVTAGSWSFLRTDNSAFIRTPGTVRNREFISTTVSNDTFSQEFSLYAKVPIFTGGLIQGGIDAKKAAFSASEEAYADLILNTKYQIEAAYLKALLAQETYKLYLEQKDLQEALLQLIRSKYKEGKALKADVLRGQTEVAEAQDWLNQQQDQSNAALFELKAQMGVDISSSIELSDSLEMLGWQGGNLDSLIQQAVSSHPAIKQARQKVAEAKAKVKMQRSEYLPQIYGQVSGNVRLPENEPNLGTGVVGLITASIPLLDRERDHASSAAKIQLLKAQQEAKDIELQLSKEIAQAWSRLETSRANVLLAEEAVQQTREDQRLTQKRFKVGRALNVEVQDTLVTLLQAELNQIKGIYAHELAKAQLKRLSGG